jgi:hypothetical protein
MNAGPLPHHEGVAAQLREVVLDIAFHGPEGGHDDDNGENADQNAEQGQDRAQLVRDQRPHGHEEAVLHLRRQNDGNFD